MKDWERAYYLRGWQQAAEYFVQGYKYRDDVLRAQFRWLLEPTQPVEGPFLTGFADALTSAFGA